MPSVRSGPQGGEDNSPSIGRLHLIQFL